MPRHNLQARRWPRRHLYTAILSTLAFMRLAAIAGAQDYCENRFKIAIKKYQVGLINEAINLVDTCLADASITKEQQGQAYELLGHAYIALDDLVKAETAIKKLLEVNPSYKADSTKSPGLFVRYVKNHTPLPLPAPRDVLSSSPIYRKSRSKFSLPVELGFGYVRRKDPTDKADDEFFIRLNPTLGLGKQKNVRLGLVNGILYTNTKTSLLGGGRIFFPLGVHSDLALDVLWGTRGQMQVGGALLFNIFTIQYGIRAAYDFNRGHRFFEIPFRTILWHR